MNKRLLSLILAISIALPAYSPVISYAEKDETADITDNEIDAIPVSEYENADYEIVLTATSETGYSYTVLNGTYCSITGYSGEETNLIIPTEIDGYIVQTIADNAFKNNTSIKKAVLPSTLETLGASAFNGCTLLEYIGFNDGLVTIGSNALKAVNLLHQ